MNLTPNEDLLRKLLQDLNEWKGDSRRFSDLVRNALDLANDRDAMLREIAETHKLSRSSIQGILRGVKRLPIEKQKKILESIRNRLEREVA